MGGSLYNKIPLGRRATIFNLTGVQIVAALAVVASIGAIFLLVR